MKYRVTYELTIEVDAASLEEATETAELLENSAIRIAVVEEEGR